MLAQADIKPGQSAHRHGSPRKSEKTNSDFAEKMQLHHTKQGHVPGSRPLFVTPRRGGPGSLVLGEDSGGRSGAFRVFCCGYRGEGVKIGRWGGAECHPFAQDRMKKTQRRGVQSMTAFCRFVAVKPRRFSQCSKWSVVFIAEDGMADV